MTTPNPLVPQGTFPEKGKSHVRIAVFTILAIHVVLLGALLIAGCKKTGDALPGDGATNANIPPPPPFDPPPALTPTNPVAPASNLVSPPPYVPPTPVAPPPGDSTAGMTEHTIVKGDTFATLAPKYNVGWKSIVDANPGVDPARLKLGQKIKIPPPRSREATTGSSNGLPPASNGSGEKTYTVKSGDNLMKIAKAHGVSLKALRTANRLQTDQIKVGKKLIIPAKAALSPETTPAAGTPPPGLTNP